MSLNVETDYKKLFDNTPIPRFIVSVKEQGGYTVMDVSTLALLYFDVGKDKMIGHPLAHFMDQENANHFQQSFEVCVDKKKPVSIQALPGVPNKIRVQAFLISPVFDDRDKVVALDVMGQPDIADQSILQRERDDAISLLTSVFDVSEIGILVTDSAGKIVRVNDSFVRAFGWPKEELINTHITGIVAPDEREQARRNHESFIAGDVRGTGEMKILCKDGHAANALFTSAALELSQKRRFLVTTVMDITLRKEMELSLIRAKEQADSANRAKSAFLANMSHELRTPLNALIGFSDMMLSETYGPVENPKYAEYIQDMNASANHLLEIINEVLDMSKIEAGRLELDESDVDVTALIKSVMRMMASKAFSSGLVMETKMQEGMPLLRADERLLRQILINLLGNAVKFSSAGAHIRLSARLDETGAMCLSVRDEGIGIPEDKIQRALEPFGQIDEGPDKSKKKQGTGLGLPLAKAMVELHGGQLILSSALGKGTSVDIIFPAARVLQK